MIPEFEPVVLELASLLKEWEPKLRALPADVIAARRNSQNRSVRQILGHLIDSASNNTHRTVHFQYRENPLEFPNYASNGNNDRWIAIQNYQEEDWDLMISHWKFSNQHLMHVIGNIDPSKLNNQWRSGGDKLISFKESIPYYLEHFKLHLREMDELISRPAEH